MPVPASRLFISLLARDKSPTLLCSSVLTVFNSSLIDCNSSFEVSSSSLVDCSSSLTDCISSLEDFSSSFEVSNSSFAACRNSSLAISASFKSAIWAPKSLLKPNSLLELLASVLFDEPIAPAPILLRPCLLSPPCASSKITKYSGDSRRASGAGKLPSGYKLATGPDATGQIVRFAKVK